MKLEMVANTGFYLEHKGVVFGADFWLTQGAFEGALFHFPTIRPTQHRISDCKYIYISHIHQDHCDFIALREARPDTVFIVPNYFDNLLERKLNAYGHKNVISMKPGESRELEPGLRVRLFGQFINNLFHQAAFGSLIDSAIALEWDGKIILNCNDNYLGEQQAREVATLYPKIDLALMPHSASGPYPACFKNVSERRKFEEAARLQGSYVSHYADMVEILKPRLAIPCAAEYVVGGELWKKNAYIGLAEPREAVAEVVRRKKTKNIPTTPILMDSACVLDVESGDVSGPPVRHYTMEDRMKFAESLSWVPYGYYWDDRFVGADWNQLLTLARGNLWQKQQRLNWKKEIRVNFILDGEPAYSLKMDSPEFETLTSLEATKKAPYLNCYMNRALFYQILTRRTHWNNAECGLHIEFDREPDEYLPELHTLLSFLHIPFEPGQNS